MSRPPDSLRKPPVPATDRGTLIFDDGSAFLSLCGRHDENLRRLERRLDVTVRVRGNEVGLAGAPGRVEVARSILVQLYELAQRARAVHIEDVDRAVSLLVNDPDASIAALEEQGLRIPAVGGKVVPKSPNQRAYLEAMQRDDIVLAVGPAGTGKTYLAMATAVTALLSHQVKHIVLTRPAVEAGERLGFLPGDLAEKVNPYLRPLYDALYDLVDYEKGQKLIERGLIEIAPLAFMRGRTLSNAFIILDEAQNCTIEQMKMFLTRIGYSSRAVVTGDITQTDLPPDKRSGLEHAQQVLAGVEGIAFCGFDERDVMRHPLVQRVILAYEEDRNRSKAMEEKTCP